jgi:alpha-galactosidase/6-phospho-beta-glucosidase family protein
MACKVVLIGGGSYGWTPTLARDMFLREGLKGSELVLVDIDNTAAQRLKKYCQMMVDKTGCGWKVKVADIEKALPGADYVCISIAVGGLDTFDRDYNIPEEYGVYHTVGDTVGPGGISRVLRNVPVFVQYAKLMEKHCPNAWLIHVTNPLSQLTRCVNLTTSIKCVGLCHNYAGTMGYLAGFFGCKRDEIDAVSVGVNHGSWLKDITIKGKPADTSRFTIPELLEFELKRKGEFKAGTLDDQINEMFKDKSIGYYLNVEMFQRYGYFPVGDAPHVVENLPWYTSSPEILNAHKTRRKGVFPQRQEGKDKGIKKVLDTISGKEPLPEMKGSLETLSGILEALHTNKHYRCIVATKNEGQITNLPMGVVVETHANVTASGIKPEMSGEVPQSVLGLVQNVVGEEEMAVEAALEGDRKKVVLAMAMSPMLHNKDKAQDLADRLLEAQKNWLPQFFRKRKK